MSSLSILFTVYTITRLLAPAADENAAPAEPPTQDRAQLHAPVAISHDSDEGIAMLAGVRTVLDEQLSDADRRRLGRKVLSASRVTMVGGAFPADATTVVTVNVPLRSKDPLAEPRLISGVFTLDAEGTLARIVVPPKMGTQRFDLRALGDVDGDGFDDLELAITGGGSDEHRLVDWHEPAAQGDAG
ncbi:MAG TPA: hypothetical protein VFG69_20875 [Nannocystaceae bacterium]|nr:hypothetical protein [Nannocystaceae bacterium]